ncbi:MAG: glycogen-debranching protein [Gaiellales bacterium]|nr:glycogen-debranching protein [Gaiellales bacterium]
MTTRGWTHTDRWHRGEGSPTPLGAAYLEQEQAINFALYSKFAHGVTLLLYRESDPVHPCLTFQLDPARHKSGRIWHCRLPLEDVQGATLYAYAVSGPWTPTAGHRFDREKVLLDPFARSVFFPPNYDRRACARPGPTAGKAPLGRLPEPDERFDWGATPCPRHGHDAIVYEMHVKGFTASPTSELPASLRGTYLGVIEKIPYLQHLGITVVELLPVQQYDPQEGNYWGYMTLNFFAPHAGYAAGDPVPEFKQMVRALHEAGIEVWLDVVYNHTSEFGEAGPTYCYRGLDNKSYYLMDPATGEYRDFAGCGNVLRTAHPVVRGLVEQSVRHWARDMRVDGFRFDLASVFTRDLKGDVESDDPAIIAELSTLGYHRDLVMVAEAWDLEAYQLGRGFPGFSWRQWNGRFQDDVRAFVRGDPGQVPNVMRRLYGSDDLFPDTLQDCFHPFQSINYVTSHDGFTLYDLVSYNRRHNEANGLGNSDGREDNLSWNCGWEGNEDVPPAVATLRRRQARNLFALLMLAAGTPMFVAGDEFLRTQHGNNNPFNQDNETSWLDWGRLQTEADFFRFARLMIAFRKAHPSLGRNRFWREDVHWHGVAPEPDLSWDSHSFAFYLDGTSHHDDDLYVIVNGWSEPLAFPLHQGTPQEWLRVVDTAQPSPEDITEAGSERRLAAPTLQTAPRSVVVLRRPR